MTSTMRRTDEVLSQICQHQRQGRSCTCGEWTASKETQPISAVPALHRAHLAGRIIAGLDKIESGDEA